MPDNQNNNNTTETRDVEESVVNTGNRNAISQSIVHVHSELKTILIFLCLAIVIAVAAATYFWNKSDKPPVKQEKMPPKFIIANPILRSDAVLIIKAGNDAANRKEPLTVEFDGLAFAEKGVPIENQADNKRQCWHFSLTDQQPPPDKLKDGEHQIRAGFSDGDLVVVQKIAFFSKPPVTAIQITDANGTADSKEIKIKAASELQIPENTLNVEMVFFHEGEEQTLSLPVKQVRDPKSGILCYEFHTKIQGFKEFSDNDPRRAEPFFGLKVTDQAGNSYYQEQSYAQYMAPGTNRFGVNDLASITVEKVPDGVSKQFIHTVRLTPQPPKRVDRLSDGVPPIKLEKVEVRTDNSRYLEWKTRVKEVKGLTLVFRDEKQIGVSTASSYIDTEKLDKDSADYRVEQEGKDGTRYLSNIEIFRKPKYNLRSKPMMVSEGDAPTIFKIKIDEIEIGNTKYKVWRPLEYIHSDFNNNEDGTVTDHATGLMWQKSGSPNLIYLKDVLAYIEKLNREKSAGYSDWRLPTVDELKSLITQEKQTNDLYINPIFEKRKYNWFWTSDKRVSGGTWGVNFFYCSVYWYTDNSLYIRAVRSRQ